MNLQRKQGDADERSSPHLPILEAFRAGDIILARYKQGEMRGYRKRASAIQRATGGNFSHALIVTTPPVLVEAIGDGVTTLSLILCCVGNLENVRVLRHDDVQVATLAGKIAAKEVGRDYSVAKAVRSIFKPNILSRIKDHGTFCSALVAECYRSAGCPIFGEIEPDRCTPATIEKLPGLVDVTKTAFRLYDPDEDDREYSLLDGDRLLTDAALQRKLSAECARIFWPQFEILLDEFPELHLELTPPRTMYGILELFIGAMSVSDRIEPDRRPGFVSKYKALDGDLASWIKACGLWDLRVGPDSAYDRFVSLDEGDYTDEELWELDEYLETLEGYLKGRFLEIAMTESHIMMKTQTYELIHEMDREVLQLNVLRGLKLDQIYDRQRSKRN